MTSPTIVESKLRQGSLKLGAAGAQVEFACQATNVTIASTYKEDGEQTEVLCGLTVAAATTVTKSLKVTAIQDFDDPGGLMVYLRAHELEEVPFSWQANPTAEIASGTVQLRLGDWGGDVGKRITTAPEWPITALTWSPPIAATGATAGTPGAFTPAGATPAANLTALQASSIVASPATAWVTGSWVTLLDQSMAYWAGAAWAAGKAP